MNLCIFEIQIDHTTYSTDTHIKSKVNTYAYTHIESTTCIARHKQAQQSMKFLRCMAVFYVFIVRMRVYGNV